MFPFENIPVQRNAVRIETEYDEQAFLQCLKDADVDYIVFEEWDPKQSWDLFWAYQCQSVFREKPPVLYVHPLSICYDLHEAEWIEVEKSAACWIVMVKPEDEMLLCPTAWTWWQAPRTPDRPPLLTRYFNSKQDEYVAQWKLDVHNQVRILLEFPLLIPDSALIFFENPSFLRQIWTIWLPKMKTWKAKDFLRREAFHHCALTLVRSLKEDSLVFSETICMIRAWASQRRNLNLTFMWFYTYGIRKNEFHSKCKTQWLYFWRRRQEWTCEEFASTICPHQLLNLAESLGYPETKGSALALSHEPIWRYARKPLKPTTSNESWFHHLQNW